MSELQILINNLVNFSNKLSVIADSLTKLEKNEIYVYKTIFQHNSEVSAMIKSIIGDIENIQQFKNKLEEYNIIISSLKEHLAILTKSIREFEEKKCKDCMILKEKSNWEKRLIYIFVITLITLLTLLGLNMAGVINLSSSLLK